MTSIAPIRVARGGSGCRLVSAAVPAATGDTRTLSEAESKHLLAGYGVPIAPERIVPDPDAAVAAASELGFPVVVKLNGDQIAHKTERGLVRLGLRSPEEVRQAAEDLLGAATPEDGPVTVLLSTMVPGRRELIAGTLRDPQFGPVVMLGLGGVLAEAIRDVRFRLAPLDHVDALEMIDELSAQRLLGEFRGEPAVDREALAATLVALGRLAADDPSVVSIDCNPLLIADGVPVAVDALVEVAGDAEVTS